MECHYPLSAGPARNRRLSSWWYYHLKVDKENKTLHDCIIIRMDQKPTLISRRGLQMSTSTSSSFLIDDILVQRPKVGIRPLASRKEVYYTSAMICKIFAKNLSAHSFLSVGYQKKYLCLYDRLSLSPLYPQQSHSFDRILPRGGKKIAFWLLLARYRIQCSLLSS